jgi:NADH dehydrogenase
MTSEQSRPHIVIVGAGFGGIYTARYLAKLAKSGVVEVTLIDRHNYFLFTPLLHEVASAGLNATTVVESIREVLRGTRVEFLQTEVKQIDTAKKVVGTAAGEIKYDYLVVSTGAESNYYGTPGADKYTLSLKNLADALMIRHQLITACEQAALATDSAERSKLLTVVIVGAGPTGVELAAEVVELMRETLAMYYCRPEEIKVKLVSTSAEVIPQFPPKLRQIAGEVLKKKGVEIMASAKVVAVEPRLVKLESGATISAATIIWVAGVKPAGLALAGSTADSAGRLQVDESLQVRGLEQVFALGDVAGALDPTTQKGLPMLAQVAVQQAVTVARNIVALIQGGQLEKFTYQQKGILISLGQWYAAGELHGVTIKGRLAWWLWRTIYLANFLSWRKRFRIAAEWTVNLFYPRDISNI